MEIDPAYPIALVILASLAATKAEFFPYAAGAVMLLLALNSMKNSLLPHLLKGIRLTSLEQPKLRMVLKPDVYQNFELAEKAVISHISAVYFQLIFQT